MYDISQQTQLISLSPLVRKVWTGLGFIFVGLGLVGMIVPVLPTTIFMILAGLCFGRSSERWYRWLMTRPFVGEHFHTMIQGKGLPMHAKMTAIIACWSMLVVVGFVFVKSDVGRVFLVVCGLIQATSVLRLPTYRPE